MNIIPRIFLIATLVVVGQYSFAADSLSNKSSRIVLVQLRSEHNRTVAMLKDKQYQKLEEVQKDAHGANAAMISDFKDNFHIYPVYYFIDSNAELIKNKQFEGILMNPDGTITKHPPLNSASRSYIIVYYGYPNPKSQGADDEEETSTRVVNSGEPMGKGLVIDNSKFEQVSYIYKMGYDDLFMGKSQKKYYYSSKHFDIEYFPLAEKLDKKLRKTKNKK